MEEELQQQAPPLLLRETNPVQYAFTFLRSSDTRLSMTIAVLTALSGTLISTTAWADTVQCTILIPCTGTPNDDNHIWH
jgi:hypothetical protein